MTKYDRPIPQSGETYKHFKGGYYTIICIAMHTEIKDDEKWMVIYRKIDDINCDNPFCRPLSMFMSEVDHEKYPEVKQKYRLQKVN